MKQLQGDRIHAESGWEGCSITDYLKRLEGRTNVGRPERRPPLWSEFLATYPEVPG
jgi:hypothetical protein